MKTCLLLVCLIGCALAQPAQYPLFAPVGVDLDSGTLVNTSTSPQTVWSETIHVPGATALQVQFDLALLGDAADFIEVLNPSDGELMRLDQVVLKQWQNHSAYFNGDTLQVRLVLAAGSEGAVTIGQVWSGIPRPTFGVAIPDSQCGGTDNRTPSSDARVCRLMRNNTTTGGGCTGWLISNTSTFVTAGHCSNPFPDFLVIAEFNVPTSTSTGATRHPPVADQYPVHQDSVQWQDTGAGNDWAVGRLHPNSTGQTAFARQGASFTLAAAAPIVLPPFILPTIRVTGYGADFNDNTRNFIQQTHTGPMALSTTADVFRYQVDTEGGNSGGPVINESTGEVFAIHTNAGCGNNNGAVTGSNFGCSIFATDVANAITSVRGNGNVNLTNTGTSFNISSASTIFNYPAVGGNWNAIAVTSDSDWDLETETNAGSNTRVASAAGGTSADVLVANGKIGTVDPISGRVYRFSGTTSARISGNDATTLTVGTPTTTGVSSTTVLALYQFNVTSAGTHTFALSGDSSWRYRVLSPGTNANWRSWSSNIVASGIVGGTPTTASLSTGWHAIVITRDGGVASSSPTDIGVLVCSGAPATVALTTTPTTITNDCQRFTVTPVANRWSGAILTSNSPWVTMIGEAYSSQGSDSGFVLTNGRNGSASPTTGIFVRTSGTANGTAAELDPQGIVATDRSLNGSMSAGQLAELFEINVTAAGSYDISVSGDAASGMFCRIYSPGTDARWIDRQASNGGSWTVGSTFVTRTLSVGYHALVIYRNGSPLATNQSFEITVCASAPVLALNPSAVGTAITEACRRVTMTPQANNWNLVGATSASGSFDVNFGEVNSGISGSDANYVIANSNRGSINPTAGVVARISGSGSANVAHGSNTSISIGVPYSAAWLAGYSFRVFEFEVSTADSYDITLTNSNSTWGPTEGPWTRIHVDDGTSDWKARGDSTFAGVRVVSGTTRTLTLNPGFHAIVVYSNSGPETISGNIQIRVEPTPNPAPTLTSISPSVMLAGSGNTNLVLTGSNFVAESVVRVNGANVATTFNSASQLTAIIPAAQLTTAGTRNITVFTPAPGGGTSAARTLTVENPVPVLTSITPTRATAGAGNTVITVNGSRFNSSSIVRLNGSNLATTLINSGRLTATIPAASLTTPNVATAITVFNPAPGGGTSASRAFTIDYPVATISAISPSERIAGTPSFTFNVSGTGFFSASQIVFGGTALATTQINPTTLRATVPAALIEAAGNRAVVVRNPAPGGGNSVATNLLVRNPTIASLTPGTIPVQPFGASVNIVVNGSNFHAGSVVYANSDALATTFISDTQLLATISSIGQPCLQVNSGLTLSVRNSPVAFSNLFVLQIGGSSNRGIIARSPIAPAPGEGYGINMFNGAPGSPFILIVDFLPITLTSTYPFIDPAANYSLNIRPVDPGTGDWVALFDGYGIWAPLNPFAAFDASGRFSTGTLFTNPNPQIGIDLTAQAFFLDPSAAVGYRMSWVRHADRL